MAHKKSQSIGGLNVTENTPQDINRILRLVVGHIDKLYGYNGSVPVHNTMDLRGNPLVNVAESATDSNAATVAQIKRLEAAIASAEHTLRALQAQVAGQTRLSGSPPTQIDAGDIAQVGTDQLAAHGDHEHPVNTGVLGNIQAIGAGSAGVSLALARADHRHFVTELATAGLPAAGAGENGRIIIENSGVTLNLILYAGNQRARIAGALF